MAGLGALALGAAPLAGGVLLGGMAGKSSPNVPDLRAVINSELELLQRIPEDQVVRRAALERMIGAHIDDLLVAQQKSREFQRKTKYFTEAVHWRDIVLFVTTLLFAVIIWHGDHHRPVWLPLLIATIVMSVVTGIEVLRGFLTSVRRAPDGDPTSATAIPNERDADCCRRWGRRRRFLSPPRRLDPDVDTPKLFVSAVPAVTQEPPPKMVNGPILLARTTTWPNRHVALSNTLSLLKYWCSLVATLTCPVAVTTARWSTTTPEDSGTAHNAPPRPAAPDEPARRTHRTTHRHDRPRPRCDRYARPPRGQPWIDLRT